MKSVLTCANPALTDTSLTLPFLTGC
jgi:hypothetical protein